MSISGLLSKSNNDENSGFTVRTSFTPFTITLPTSQHGQFLEIRRLLAVASHSRPQTGHFQKKVSLLPACITRGSIPAFFSKSQNLSKSGMSYTDAILLFFFCITVEPLFIPQLGHPANDFFVLPPVMPKNVLCHAYPQWGHFQSNSGILEL